MGTESTYTKRANEILPPVASQGSVQPGSTTPATLDLSTVGQTVVNMAFADNYPASLAYSGSTAQANVVGATLSSGKGCIDGYVDFTADGADFGIVFGPTLGAVGGSGATAAQPSLGATGTNAAGICQRVFAGTTRTFYIHPQHRYLGYVGSTGAGYLRIFPSSRNGG